MSSTDLEYVPSFVLWQLLDVFAPQFIRIWFVCNSFSLLNKILNVLATNCLS